LTKYFYTDVFQRGDWLYIRGYSNGKRFQEKLDYHPFLFVPSADGEFRSLKGQPLKRKVFGSMKDAKQFVKDNSDVSNFQVHGNTAWLYQYINEEYVRDGKIWYDKDLIKINYIDIENDWGNGFPNPMDPQHQITAISILQGEKTISFGCKAFRADDPKITYIMCKDEADLLNNFLDAWESEEWSPDVVTGWNIAGYDIPYLYNRIKKILGEKAAKRLSPWGIITEREFEGFKGQTKTEYILMGTQVIDYLDLYKKFSFVNQESYKLDHIAYVELGEKKIDYSEHKNLMELHQKDFEKFINYNIKDNKLVYRLEAKKKFLSNVLFFAYDARINYVDALTTVRVWDVITTNYLLEQRIAVPQYTPPSTGAKIMGGHVKEPFIGLSRWVVTFDYTSLYPKLMMGWNISPDVFVKMIDMPISADKYSGERCISETLSHPVYEDMKAYLKKNNLTLCPNGALFSRSKQGFMSFLMEKMYDDRFEAQKKLKAARAAFKKDPKNKELENRIDELDNFQKARKIQLNACYGAMANKYFRFYNSDVAEAVTSIGQMAIQFSERKLNAYLNKLLKTTNVDYIVAIDTDSVHITFDRLVDAVGLKDAAKDKVVDFLSKVCAEKIEPFLVKVYEEFSELTNAFKNTLHMKQEGIADKGIWRGAKMYILNQLDREKVRLDKPELLVHGIEAVRSSTPEVCRTKIKEALKIIMGGTEKEYQIFIKNFRNEFWDLPFEQIAKPSTANNLEEFTTSSGYRKGTPQHIKGAIIYNNYLQEKGLTDTYETIFSGNKTKSCYLTTPNPVRSNVISTPGPLPAEFNLDKYIDRDMQFTKTFLAPIQSISSLTDWKTEKKNTLEGLFE